LSWKNKPDRILSKVTRTSSLRFGGGLSTEEQRYIAEQYRQALINHYAALDSQHP
jgi:hypothetical protein